MTPVQQAVDESAVETVPRALFPSLEREVPPHESSQRQQTREKDVGAEVHVMMTVDSIRFVAIETAELVDLGGHDVLERLHEPRIEHDRSEAVASQVPCQLLLAFHESRRTARP
jgi:hypothetical protein